MLATTCGFKSHLPHPFLKDVFAEQNAEVAELADAQASGACGSNTVRVQVPPSAFFCFLKRIAGMNKRVRPKGLGSFLYGGFEKPPRNITRGIPSVLRQSHPLVSPLPEHARK